MKRFLLALILCGVPVAWGLYSWRASGSLRTQEVGLGFLAAGALTAVLLITLELIGARPNGYLWVVVGKDGRTSTSKTVVAVWTLAISFALVVMIVLALRHPDTDPSLWLGASDWDSYVALLGLPVAGAVTAAAIRAEADQRNPTRSTEIYRAQSPRVRDIFTSGSGRRLASDSADPDDNASIADTQYVIFNAVAFLYFAGAFVTHLRDFSSLTVEPITVEIVDALAKAGTIGLPAIPPVLLWLSGVTVAGYSANKAIQYLIPRN